TPSTTTALQRGITISRMSTMIFLHRKVTNSIKEKRECLKPLAALTLALDLLQLTAQAAPEAQDYPSSRISIIVPFTTGGSNDVLARSIGAKLAEAWGQPVVVENRPGAAGNIGGDAVAKAK